MEITELYYPQAAARAGPYTFTRGIEVEVCSAKESHSDWAKIRFTEGYRPEISLARKDPAAVQVGYGGVLDDVFTGYVAAPYSGGTHANEIVLKDEMMVLEDTVISDTFLDTTPQEIIAAILAKAGITDMKLSGKAYPPRRIVPVRQQNAVRAVSTVSAAWGIRAPFFFSGGVFYWDEKPEQQKVYTFEYGVNILGLNRTGGVWELETVSAPFVKHSHRIRVVHPRVNGEVEVQKVVLATNDAGFIRTCIYF